MIEAAPSISARGSLLAGLARRGPRLVPYPRAFWTGVPPVDDDVGVSEEAGRRGVEAAPLSAYYAGACPRPGLVLGYAGIKTDAIAPAVERLAAAVAASAPRSD